MFAHGAEVFMIYPASANYCLVSAGEPYDSEETPTAARRQKQAAFSEAADPLSFSAHPSEFFWWRY
ncbi:hypothetical protein ACWCQW_21360 [Streptomyces mirabilis]